MSHATPRHATPRLAVALALLVLPARGWAAPCTTWNAGYSVAPHSSKGSVALTHTWTPTANCDTFTFDHYRACWFYAASDSPPTGYPSSPNPTSSTCQSLASAVGASSSTSWVQRSDSAFNSRIFACQNSTCTQYWGDGTYGAGITTDSDRDEATTEVERWLMPSVEDYEDTDRVVADTSANVSAAMFYPEGFEDGDSEDMEGVLGLWYSTKDGGIEVLRYQRAATSGWQDFNNTTWDVSALEIGRGTDDTGDFGSPTHPVVLPVVETDGMVVDRFVRMIVQVEAGAGDPYQIWQVDSLDDLGTEFGLECVSGPCSVHGGTCADEELCDWSGAEGVIEADGSSGSFYLTSASHCRLIYDYIGLGAWDPDVDDLSLIFTGSPGSCGTGPDDVFLAEWTGSAWDVPVSGSCALPEWADRHDPGVIPFPDGGFKAYLHKDLDFFEVCYHNGVAWEYCREIEFVFDDGFETAINPACLENIDTLVFIDGGPQEGGFVKIWVDRTTPQYPSAVSCFDTAGIAFIEHTN